MTGFKVIQKIQGTISLMVTMYCFRQHETYFSICDAFLKTNIDHFIILCWFMSRTGVDGLLFSTTSPDVVASVPPLDPNLPQSHSTAAPKPIFTVRSLGVQRVPNAGFRAGQSNNVALTVTVNYDRSRTTDIALPGWQLDVWASSKKNGKGPKVSQSRLNLGNEASNRPFTVPSVVRFSNQNYDLNLNGQSCSKNTKYLCVKFSKTGSGFALKGKQARLLRSALRWSTVLRQMGALLTQGLLVPVVRRENPHFF